MSLGKRTTPPTLLWVLALLTLLLCQRAVAQTMPELETERFAPATSPDGFLGVQATRTLGPGRYVLLAFASFEAQPLVLDPRLPMTPTTFAPGAAPEFFSPYELREINSRYAAWLGGELGIGGRMAVGALLPMLLHQNLDVTSAASSPLSESDNFGAALGDARVHARYRVLGESSSHADAPKDGPGIAFELRAGLPTHTGDGASGEARVSSELHLLADFQLLGAGVGGDLGWKHRFGATRATRYHAQNAASVSAASVIPDPIDFHDELVFGAAIKLPLPPVPSIVPILEVRGATDFSSAQATSIELDLGAHILLGAFTLSVGGGFGLSDGYGTPDGRLLLGLAFTPLDSDGDKDGVDDAKDQCPFLAEDKDGFQDQDGCPDPDNDNDLIPDLDDLCPNETAEEDKDQDEDGCTDGTKPTKAR